VYVCGSSICSLRRHSVFLGESAKEHEAKGARPKPDGSKVAPPHLGSSLHVEPALSTACLAAGGRCCRPCTAGKFSPSCFAVSTKSFSEGCLVLSGGKYTGGGGAGSGPETRGRAADAKKLPRPRSGATVNDERQCRETPISLTSFPSSLSTFPQPRGCAGC